MQTEIQSSGGDSNRNARYNRYVGYIRDIQCAIRVAVAVTGAPVIDA